MWVRDRWNFLKLALLGTSGPVLVGIRRISQRQRRGAAAPAPLSEAPTLHGRRAQAGAAVVRQRDALWCKQVVLRRWLG